MVNALWLEKDDAGFRASVQALPEDRWPALGDRDVRISVEYSTLNYKDALALKGKDPAAIAARLREMRDGGARHPTPLPRMADAEIEAVARALTAP